MQINKGWKVPSLMPIKVKQVDWSAGQADLT